MPDDKPPSGFDRTIQGHAQEPGTDATVAAPAPKPAPKSPFQKTITAPPIASAPTMAESIAPSASSSTNRAVSSRSGSGRSTVGNEMRGASIERFTLVESDRFELLDELARGGLGRVFRARDPRTGRIVALKEVLHPQPEIVARFAREALVTANLQHPSIVPVYEVGRWPGGEPFYAMKLVEGRTLDALIGEAKTQADRIALLPHVIDVAEALAYAHSERVIHRDLKPANVLVGAYGETVVIDWGLAKNLATGEEIEVLPVASTIPPESNETIAGSVLGTPAYMPPEQAIGEKLDERADVYAIGAILYHVLAGARPFAQAKTLDELLELVAFKTPAPLAHLAPDLPPELVAIVEHAMARDPAQRYATAQGIARDLRAFQAGKLVAAHRYTSRQLVRRWIAQHKAVVATATVALGVLIVVGAIGVWRIANERDEANHQRVIAQRERVDAQDARGLAEQRFADSLQELARQALLANDPARALPLAVGALATRASTASPALTVITAQARAPYAALAEVIPSPAFGVNVGMPSPSGDRLYTASGGDETIRAWDIAKRAEAWRTKGGYMVAVSPDGAHLATATNAGELVVFSAADGKVLARYPITQRGDLASNLWWSPDNVHFAAASDSGKVWLGAIGQAPRALAGHTSKVNTLEFSPDGKLLASGGETSGIVILHDAATGEIRARIAEATGGVWGLGWLDADHLLIGDARFAKAYDLRSRSVTWTIDHGTWVYGILVGPDHGWILTYGDGATARLWDFTTHAKIADLSGHNVAIAHAIAAGDWIVTGDELGNGFVWDPRSGERVQILPRDSVVFGIAMAGTQLVVFGESRQELWTLPPANGSVALVRRLPIHAARVRDLAFAPDGALWTASNDGAVRRTTLDGASRTFSEPARGYSETIRTSASIDLSKPPYEHGMRSFTLGGATVTSANEDGSIIVWDVASGTERARFTGHLGRARKIVYTADGKTAYSVGDSSVRRWDVATGAQTAISKLDAPGWDVTVFPDGTVATLDDAAPARGLALWTPDLVRKPATFEPSYMHELPLAGDRLIVSSHSQIYQIDSAGTTLAHAPQAQVFTASIGAGPSGPRWSVAGDPRGDIVLRDWATGDTVRSWTASDGIVVAVAFSPDGELVASLSGNRARIWDPHTGALLTATPVLPAVLTQLAWSADGARLAIAGSVGTVWVWDVRPPLVAADLPAFTRCASPWTLVAASLEKAPADAKGCRLLAR